MTPDDFITRFHNLEGISLKEKKKSLHNLLQTLKNAPTDTVDSILQKLKPATYLEETFKTEILVTLRRTNDLLNVLKNGNEVEASKIIKQDWFIKELTTKFTVDQFVQDVFPNLSLSVRMKVLKKLLVYVKDEDFIKKMFEKLYSTYGWQTASVLLTGCTNEKIKEMLEKHLCWLSSSKLKLLFNKNSSLITFYFEKMKQEETYLDNYKWRTFFSYVAKKDPVFFDELSKKFDIYARNFGRQTTKKFLEAKHDEIMANPNKYISFLRKDALVRKLGDDFPEFYRKALPKDLQEFQYCNVKSLMKHYSKSKQYQLYMNAFQEKYNKSLWDNTDYMDERLIELIPDKEEREKWIKKFEKRLNYEKYRDGAMMARCAMKCSLQFDEEDYMMSDDVGITERKTVFNTLISTCKMNNDYDALLNVLKSFCQRHRNSDVSILYNFLRFLYEELEMDKLTSEHWKYINEIITLQLFKKQKLFFPIFIEYIRFLHSQNQPVEELVVTLLKEIPTKLVDFKYKDDDFEKFMLELYVKSYPQVMDDIKLNLAVQIVLSVRNWNKKHSQNPISVHAQEKILENFLVLKKQEKLSDKALLNAMKYLICRQEESREVSKLDQMYWENFKNWKDSTITRWFLKYKPEIFKNNLNKIGMMLENKNKNLINNLRKYEHMDIPNIITKLCLEELETAEPSKRDRVIKILVYFMSSQDFHKFFEKYIPTVDKVDTAGGSEDVRKSYEIQCALGKYLRNRINVGQHLQDLLKYCRGDVRHSALPSLYSSFCRIPENQLDSALNDLRNKAVSTRKHAIFLTALISPVEKVLKNYNQVQNSEKNLSVKQHMFLSCYKYYLRNNIEECWPLLQDYIAQIKKEQKDILKLLANVHKIPANQRAVFTECVWDVLCKVKKDGAKLDENMQSLLSNLHASDVKLLRDNFTMNIIENYLFDLDDGSMNSTVFDLTNSFLISGGNTEKKVIFIFNCIHKLKEKFWNDNEKKIDILKMISKFCFEIFKKMLSKDEVTYDKKLPKLFSEAWKKEFTVEETFEEHIFLDFVVLHTASDSSLTALSKEMNDYFSAILEKYGNLIIGNFKYFLSFFLSLIYKGDDYDLKVLKFLDDFLECKCSPEHCALVVDILPGVNHKEEVQELYNKLLKKLLENDQIVKICLYGKLKENSIGYY